MQYGFLFVYFLLGSFSEPRLGLESLEGYLLFHSWGFDNESGQILLRCGIFVVVGCALLE